MALPGHGRIQRFGARWRSRAPILCYHSVSDDAAHPLARYGVSPGLLRRQLGLLRRLGYRSQTVRELVAAYEAGQPIGKTVVLTFDDGYRDTFTTAAPILAAFGFRATLFVVTDLVGQTARWDASRGQAAPLADWEQIRALRDQGWEIGLHTATHPDLTTLSPNALAYELDDALRVLERAVGATVASFAYPYGSFSPAVESAVRATGLRAAVRAGGYAMTTARSPRFAMPRCSMRRSDRLIDILSLITLGFRVTEAIEMGIQRVAPHQHGREPPATRDARAGLGFGG